MNFTYSSASSDSAWIVNVSVTSEPGITKEAVTVVSASIVTTHGSVPLQPPPTNR